MSDSTPISEPMPAATPKKRRSIVEYLVVLGILGIIIIAALYQEQISSFFSLKLWDKGAPGRTVTAFLSAGKKGDQELATSYLGTSELKPLMKDGKWQGYFLVSQAGTLEFIMQDLAPSGEPTATNTEFMTLGKGAATVMVPDSKGKPVEYRLEMKDGWKITEIRGGRVAGQKAPQEPAPRKAPTVPRGG
jgi:hypothetical protein